MCIRKEIPNRIPPTLFIKWLQYKIKETIIFEYENEDNLDLLTKKKIGTFKFYSSNELSPQILETIIEKFFIEKNVGSANKTYNKWNLPDVDAKTYYAKKYGWTKFWNDSKDIWFSFYFPARGKVGFRELKN